MQRTPSSSVPRFDEACISTSAWIQTEASSTDSEGKGGAVLKAVAAVALQAVAAVVAVNAAEAVHHPSD
jgi:hypothetical protein